MARKRNPENKGLPARWRYSYGAYRYQVPPGMEKFWDGKKTFKLGETLAEAYKVWADRVGSATRDSKTIGDLLDRYCLEVVPELAASNRANLNRGANNLRRVFGEMPIDAITPQYVYQYVDKRKKKNEDGTGGLRVAKFEANLLRDVYSKAVEWGLIKNHPFKGDVRIKGNKPRTRYVEDWEFLECMSLQPPKRARSAIPVIQAYMRLKLLTGLRLGDMLRLKTADITEEGIKARHNKTGKDAPFKWTPALREAVDIAMSVRPVDISPFLFCTSRGKSYINIETGDTSAWKSIWQRFMKKAIEETDLQEKFTDHDLRAKCASDAKTLEHAQKLLGHVDSRITDRVYRRKVEWIDPLK